MTTGSTPLLKTALAAATLLSRAAFVAGQDCVDDISALVEAEYAVTNTDELRTYVLCPDTTFDIGVFNAADFTYEGGQSALELFQPNVHVLCGEDGSVDNNCVFSGGTFHVDSYLFDDTIDPPLANVLVSGVTFSGADFSVNIFMLGEITFKDCLFTGNTDSLSIIYMEGTNPLDAKLTLDSCNFVSNSGKYEGEDDGVTSLIYNVGQELVVKSCLFQDNTIITPEGVTIPDDWTTCLVGAFDGSETELDGCCFIDNVNVFAPMYGEDSIYRVDVDRVLSYSSGDYECNGLAEFVDVDPFVYECFNATGESCSLSLAPTDPTLAPINGTAAPTEEPVDPTNATAAPTEEPAAPTEEPATPTEEPATPTKQPTGPLAGPPTSMPTTGTVPSTEVPTAVPAPPSGSLRLSRGLGFVLAAAIAAFLGAY